MRIGNTRAGYTRTIVLGLLLLGAVPNTAWAASAERALGAGLTGRAQRARALFERADLGRFASDIGRTLREESQSTGASLDPAARARFEAVVEGVTEANRLRSAALAAFTPLYDEGAAVAVRTWYGSVPGKRLLAMEARATEANWDHELEGFVSALDRKPATLERLRRLRRLAEASGAGEDAVTMQLRVARVLDAGVRALQGETARRGATGAQAAWKEREDRLRARMSMQLAIVMLYVYREASDEELLHYAEFAEGPAARWLFDANRSAVGVVFSRVERELVSELSAYSPHSPHSPPHSPHAPHAPHAPHFPHAPPHSPHSPHSPH